MRSSHSIFLCVCLYACAILSLVLLISNTSPLQQANSSVVLWIQWSSHDGAHVTFAFGLAHEPPLEAPHVACGMCCVPNNDGVSLALASLLHRAT
jgi:hypothetical protein